VRVAIARSIFSTLLLTALLRGETNRLAQAVQKAGDYYRQGKHQEAEKSAAEAIAILESSRPVDDNFDDAASLNDLGALLYARGDTVGAEQLFQRARADYEALAGPDDTRLASVLYNLAGVSVEQGRYAQAEPLYRTSLEIREKSFGAAHPLAAEARNDIGFLYLQQGKYKEAEGWLEKAFRDWESATGFEAYAAVALNNLALLNRLQGRFDKAESLYKQAAAVEEKAFGAEHPELATTRMSLGALYQAWGKNGQAIEAYKQALALLEKTVGAQDPLAIEARGKLSALEAVKGRR